VSLIHDIPFLGIAPERFPFLLLLYTIIRKMNHNAFSRSPLLVVFLYFVGRSILMIRISMCCSLLFDPLHGSMRSLFNATMFFCEQQECLSTHNPRVSHFSRYVCCWFFERFALFFFISPLPLRQGKKYSGKPGLRYRILCTSSHVLFISSYLFLV